MPDPGISVPENKKPTRLWRDVATGSIADNQITG
jgi:hypothetical protein